MTFSSNRVGIVAAVAVLLTVASCASGRTPARKLFARGVEHAEANRLAEAEKAFAELVARGEYLPESRNNLGVVQAAAGRYREAAATLRAAAGSAVAGRNLEALGYADAPRESRLELMLVGRAPSAKTPQAAPRDPAAIASPPRAAPRPEAAPPPAPPPSADSEAEAIRRRIRDRIVPRDDADSAALPMPELVDTAPVGQPPPPPLAAAVDLEAVRRQIRERIHAWAHAWDEQNVEAYLSFYSLDFRPRLSPDREAWRASRVARVERPAFIDLELGEIEVGLEGRGRAIAAFPLAYKAEGHSDEGTKTLVLALEEGIWRIVEESNR